MFGHVVGGEEVVQNIENIPVNDMSRPIQDVKIVNCGELILKSKRNYSVLVTEIRKRDLKLISIIILLQIRKVRNERIGVSLLIRNVSIKKNRNTSGRRKKVLKSRRNTNPSTNDSLNLHHKCKIQY